MRAVLQRVTEASVTIDGQITGSIKSGLLVLLGIEVNDTQQDASWLSKKIAQMRIFSDEAGLMNRSVKDLGAEVLLVSQFTLHAVTKKGNRPSFIAAARPELAVPLYEYMIAQLQTELGKAVATGKFGADMKVMLVNDGPVTIIVDSKEN